MADTNQKGRKVLLTILDGWGIGDKPQYDAVVQGANKTWQDLVSSSPTAELLTFGESVGLPKGQMGNSEVGHTAVGAGRIIWQDLPRINKAIEDKEFDQKELIQNAINKLANTSNSLHIMGLFSDGGVHSHMEHFLYVIELFAKNQVNVVIHLFTDGRDTPPNTAIQYIEKLLILCDQYANIYLATISGRYYAMDRDKRWDRVELAYNAIVSAKGEIFSDAKQLLQNSYQQQVFDEFIIPAVHENYTGMKDNDSIFVVNFRADRVRQLLDSLLNHNFKEFSRDKLIAFNLKLAMVKYSDYLAQLTDIVFPVIENINTLGEWVAKAGLKQLRIAETEKYPHVTFFFSGGREEAFDGEERILIPSPKVATYDLKPEMSAFEITDNLVDALDSLQYDLIIANYANGDMVGHTGVLDAAIKATSAVDKCLERVKETVERNDYVWLIIADHGNCELMWDERHNTPHTQHTTNLVNIVLYNYKHNIQLHAGGLSDIAPTILKLMNLPLPNEMEGKSLIEHNN